MLKTSDPKHPNNWHKHMGTRLRPETKPDPLHVCRRRLLEAARERRQLDAQFAL